MKEGDEVYRILQKRIDALPVPFPATSGGAELRLLRHLFNSEEASAACQLSALSEPISKIYRRGKRNGLTCSSGQLKKLLNGLLAKGAITGGVTKTRRGVERTYSLIPLAIGMFEMQVDNLTEEYTRDFEEYLDGEFGKALLTSKTGQLRTVPVGTSIESSSNVGSYDDIRRYVSESEGPFGVMNCVCRQGKDLLKASCDHSDIRETCLTIGASAVGMKRRGNARLVDREEFLALLQRAEEKGFVLQASNTREPSYICCCCGDCCEVLTTAKKLPRPASAFHTNFYAVVDAELCNGCARCVSRCQMDAVRITAAKTAVVDLDRCIGCGLCVTTCPSGSLSLSRKMKTITPPRNSTVMFGKMYLERRGPLGAVLIAAKYLLGMKI